jgi:3-oxoisoapionate decarboxylase
MLLGLSSFTFTWEVGVPGHPVPTPLTPRRLLHRTAGAGLRVVQFADNLPLDALDQGELADLADEARELGVALEVGTRGIGADRLRRVLAVAATAGSPFVRIVVDTAGDHPTPAEVVTRLRAVESDFRDAGVLLAIENHDRFSTRQLLDILDELGDWTAIVLDTVNSLGALEPPETVVAALGPRAVNLHVKDFTIRRHSHQMGFEIEGTPAGDGLLDIPDVVDRLEGTGRVRSAILELWTPPAADIVATIEREKAWAERSIAFLRTVAGLEAA